ncbi:MAG: anthranilate synthase component I family protein [Polyangiaceae bacterium]
MTVVRSLRLPPDPPLIARALAGHPGLAVLASRPEGATRVEDARWSFVACEPDGASDDLMPPPETGEDGTGWNGAPGAPRWIGVVPYEALRGLERGPWTRNPDERPSCALRRAAWRRYPAVVRVDHLTGSVSVEADDESSASRLSRAVERGLRTARGGFELDVLAPDEPDRAHTDRIHEALRLIAAGDLYEVNLARRIPLLLRGDPLALFESLLDAAPAPWGFFQDLGEALLCGASPELALSVRDEVLRTCPIKGTRPRGTDAVADAEWMRELEADPKERAELVMAVDVHRSDLGRVAVPGSVRVLGQPRVVAGRGVWSRVAEVSARRAPGMSLDDIATAVLPCGSVTGAPKVRAMEVIATLEPWRRSAYTGVFGYVGRTGALELAMAIRTIEVAKVGREQRACYFAGGGIVADSIPERELEETRWKAAQLSSLSRP